MDMYCNEQGVIFPEGVRVFPAENLQNPQEILTKTLIIEQILWKGYPKVEIIKQIRRTSESERTP